MELGKRIKQARLEKGLSQRQLCGDEITRNMLSQIENGSAKPSMATLGYLARQLGKPISYFLEEQGCASANGQIMVRLRRAYADGAYDQIPGILEQYSAPDEVFDPERYLLEALALLVLSQQVQAQGKTVYAQTLLEKVKLAGAQTPYYTLPMERERLLQLYEIQPEQARELVKRLPADSREQLLRAQAALEENDAQRSARILDAVPEDTAQWQYLRGKAAMQMQDYALATEYLLQAETTYPLDCAKALEQCYRELEDYKRAYFYACKQR